MAEWVANLGIWWYVLFYFVIQLVNVILNTLKTIITARASKIPAAIINALTFGFYTIVVALTADISNLWINMIITIIANLIGVYFSIAVLDKMRKDKLWEITATISGMTSHRRMQNDLLIANISFNYDFIIGRNGTEVAYHIYAPTQKESEIIKKILIKYNAKYIVHEENAKL